MINHNNHIKPHNTKNHKKFITNSGNQSFSTITSGNNETILPTRLKTSDITHQRIIKNNNVGKINNSQVKKLLLIFLLSSNFQDFITTNNYIIIKINLQKINILL